MTAAVMMGYDMKGADDLLTIKIQGDGPIGGLVVTADSHGEVKGYAFNPGVMLPPNDKGKLDVGGALGVGVLSVIKDIGLKEPYVGQTILVSGEISGSCRKGTDLTFCRSGSDHIICHIVLSLLFLYPQSRAIAVYCLLTQADYSLMVFLISHARGKQDKFFHCHPLQIPW